MSPETVARLVRSLRTVGLKNSWQLYRERNRDVAVLHLPFLQHPLHVRRTRTDRHVFQQVFERRDYDIPGFESLHPKVIVDAGAHAGFTSVFFANCYPDAVIHALEPHPGNFDLLQANAKPYRNIRPVNAALWYETGTVALQDPEAESFAFQFGPGAGTASVTVEQIVPEGQIDILKMDVEGAERDIFERHPAWLSRLRLLLIETHDQLLPGCSRALFNALAEYDYDRVIRGDVDVVLLHTSPS